MRTVGNMGNRESGILERSHNFILEPEHFGGHHTVGGAH